MTDTDHIKILREFLEGGCEYQPEGFTSALRSLLARASAGDGGEWAKGVKACIAWVEKRRHDFESEYGMVDPSTGAMEFRSVAKEEYDAELGEIEEGLRSLLAAAPQPQTCDCGAKPSTDADQARHSADCGIYPPAHGDGEGDAIAPWPDFAGNQIRDRDRIRHPDGTTGTVLRLADLAEGVEGEAWRVVYGGGDMSRLSLQIGDKGQAVVLTTRPAPEAQEARDAARLDFITAVPGQFSTVPQKTSAGNYVIHMQGLGYFHGATAREAIDAALALPAQGGGL